MTLSQISAGNGRKEEPGTAMLPCPSQATVADRKTDPDCPLTPLSWTSGQMASLKPVPVNQHPPWKLPFLGIHGSSRDCRFRSRQTYSFPGFLRDPVQSVFTASGRPQDSNPEGLPLEKGRESNTPLSPPSLAVG